MTATAMNKDDQCDNCEDKNWMIKRPVMIINGKKVYRKRCYDCEKKIWIEEKKRMSNL